MSERLREKALHFADELEAEHYISLTPKFLRDIAAALGTERPAQQSVGEKLCSTCRHVDLYYDEQPCGECTTVRSSDHKTHTKWEAKAKAATLEDLDSVLQDAPHDTARVEVEDMSISAALLTNEIDRLHDILRQIGDLAHDASTGPAVPDVLWEIRSMAYEGIGA